ncbi:unnamed protein product [Paramecium primaurelia]|uniref:Amine oxidase domain-containing protein n=1 Tax=Paramecium primaurelia TaxID=5886 RepID=A0A8S1QHP4_PARPR|nr:unnamed protein product [Paramecium primaurelia]
MNQNILVIGAGVAGLASAQYLIKQGCNVRLFEASNRYGGRVKPLIGFSDRHLEAGGQTIHHPDNDYYKMAIETGAKLEIGGDLVGSIYDPIQKKVISYKEFEDLYKKESQSLDDFINDRFQEDEPVLQRLQRKGYNMEFIHLFYALYGSEYGASIEKIGARAIGRYEFDMPMFVSDYEIENYIHHQNIIDKFFKEAIEIIEYNKQVISIKIINEKVQVQLNNDPNEFSFDYAICCVPVTQLKKLKVDPAFDESRLKQINLVGMDKGGKFFIKLDKKFLQHEEDFFLPKFNHNSLWWDSSSENQSIIIGLLGLSAHNRVMEIGIEQFAKEIVQTINEQYKVDLKVISYHYEDWGNTPFIEGLYSYPMSGIDDNYRQIISAPHQNRLYFAGEAYHPIYYSTIHGAYESGIKAAKEIIK